MSFTFAEPTKLPSKKPISATGILYKADSGEYTLITGKSKSRKTIHIKEKKGYEDVYASLSAYVEQKVKIEGRELSRKSLWNVTIELVSLTLAD